MTTSSQPNGTPEALRCYSLVIVCEDEVAHAYATGQCHRMALQHWRAVDFQFKWWLFANLSCPDHAECAAAAAATADVIVLCTQPAGALPDIVRHWLESWPRRRGRREGTMVDLTVPVPEAPAGISLKQVFLRQVAREAGLDFLPHLPTQLAGSAKESRAWLNERAALPGKLLSGIVNHLPVPTPPAVR